MAEEQYQERTLPATPKRREEARERGDIAKSRDLVSGIMIIAAAFLLYSMGKGMSDRMVAWAASGWASLITTPLTQKGLSDLIHALVNTTLGVLIPVVGFFTLIAVLASVGHYGWVWSSHTIQPDWGRVNPISGWNRLFTLTAFFELGKTLLKFLVIGFVVYKVVRGDLTEIITSVQMMPLALSAELTRFLVRLLFFTGLVMLVLGLTDYGYQWWDRERRLRMTPQEMKEELRQTEGDPLIKARIRSIQREIARKRMMAEVPKATVVITNPTHYAVALRYDGEKMAAPRVIAKGAGFLAQTIREIAEAHGVVRVENKPLAQTLYKTVDVGAEIPSSLYRAVAEILVYVYRLKNDPLTFACGVGGGGYGCSRRIRK